jgi:osmotically-inducible protein OsmY
MDPEHVQRAVQRALRNTSATRRLGVSARVLEGGVVELTGVAPDERTRQAAGEAASAVAGADVVVNRILVEGRDVPPGVTAPGSGT